MTQTLSSNNVNLIKITVSGKEKPHCGTSPKFYRQIEKTEAKSAPPNTHMHSASLYCFS